MKKVIAPLARRSAADLDAKGPSPRFLTRSQAARTLAILVFALAVSLDVALAADAPNAAKAQASMLDQLQPGDALFVPVATVRKKTGEVRVVSARLPEVIAFAWNVSQTDLVFDVDLDHEQLFHAAARPIDGKVVTGKKMLRELIKQRFDIKVTQGTKQASVLILDRLEGGPTLTPSLAERSSLKSEPGRIIARRVAMPRLARVLRNQLQTTIVNETNLEDRYDFVLAWDPNSMPISLMDALNDMGLKLASGTREVPVLTIRSAAAKSPNSEKQEPNARKP